MTTRFISPTVVLTLVFGIFLNSALHAEDWAEKMFPIQAHDFGTIPQYSLAEFSFPVNNVYREQVSIESATSSCGCSTVTVINPILERGQTGYIHVKINSGRFVGYKGAVIKVRISQPYPTEVELYIRVNVEQTSN